MQTEVILPTELPYHSMPKKQTQTNNSDSTQRQKARFLSTVRVSAMDHAGFQAFFLQATLRCWGHEEPRLAEGKQRN